LPLLAGAFAGGMVLAAALGGPWAATALVTALLAASATLRGRLTPLIAVAAIATATAGHARYLDERDAPPPPVATTRGPHLVEGTLRAGSSIRGRTARADLDVVRLDGRPTNGGLRLTYVATDEPLRAGDRVVFRGEIEDPPAIEAFDYAAYLRGRDIHGVVAFPDTLRILARNEGTLVERSLRAVRRSAIERIERSLPEPEASLAIGMLLGRQATLAPSLEADLRTTGTSHLVVVSGQNVALVLGVLTALLAAALPRRRAATIALCALPAYVLLVGAEPPVVRAAVMAAGLVPGAATGRRSPGWIYLLYATALMLALEPGLVDSASFQLSVTATAGVILVAPPLRDTAAGLLHTGTRGLFFALVEVWATATGALLTTLPVQVAVFESVPLAALPANIAVAPLYPAILTLATLAAMAGGIDAAADLLWSVGAAVPRLFVDTVHAFAAVEAAPVSVREPFLFGAGWYALLGGATWLVQRRPTFLLAPRAAARALAPVTVLAIGVGFAIAALGPAPEAPAVTVLDVGQGLAVLVRGSEGVALVDAGLPDGSALRALPRSTARTLTALVVTHRDIDHAGGAAEIDRRMRVRRILGQRDGAEPLAAGDRLDLGGGTQIEVLSPPREGFPGRTSENDRSLVLLVTLDGQRVLLAADVEAATERWLVRGGQPLDAAALVAPHHGSRTSSTAEFIEAVTPSMAVISAGAGNPYGHPHPEVVERYQARGVRVLNTAQHGTVTLRARGGSIEAVTAR
jgi:competence protein ComEC